MVYELFQSQMLTGLAGDVLAARPSQRETCWEATFSCGLPRSVSRLRTGLSNWRFTNKQSQTSAAIDVTAGAQRP